jgi:hypothetical protein
MSRILSTTCHLSKYNGVLGDGNLNLYLAHLISYASLLARLSGPEAAWANRKYHGHRTLPPDMATKLKTEHEEKYGMQGNNV